MVLMTIILIAMAACWDALFYVGMPGNSENVTQLYAGTVGSPTYLFYNCNISEIGMSTIPTASVQQMTQADLQTTGMTSVSLVPIAVPTGVSIAVLIIVAVVITSIIVLWWCRRRSKRIKNKR